MKRKMLCVLDTETANTFTNEKGILDALSALVYDMGWVIMDTLGNVLVSRSFLCREIFCLEKSLMNSCYYADKYQNYWNEYKEGKRVIANFMTIRKIFYEDLEKYGVKEIYGHNMYFDVNALNSTYRYLTKSKYRNFFHRDLVICDSMKMAYSTLYKQKQYKQFCYDNGLVTANGRPRVSAEVLYKYITKDLTFVESHTGLEDVMIEKEIVLACRKTHMKMNKLLNSPKKVEPLQWELYGKDLVKNYHRELTKVLPNKKLLNKKYKLKGVLV